MSEAPRAILFVCLGNICRSPLAEAVARQRIAEAGLGIEVASRGTGDWHIGHPADPRARAVAQAHGYTLEPHRARQLTSEDFARYDLLLGMDASNLRGMQALQPATHAARLGLLLEAAGLAAGREVPDPYFGGDDGFVDCLRLIELGIDRLLATLRSPRR